jgi:hypothetical protein
MFNIVASELVFAAAFLGVLVLTWPDPPWDALLYGGVVVMLVAPFVFYPFSKTLFLAFDLIFRPPSQEDFDQPRVTRPSAPPAPVPPHKS